MKCIHLFDWMMSTLIVLFYNNIDKYKDLTLFLLVQLLPTLIPPYTIFKSKSSIENKKKQKKKLFPLNLIDNRESRD